MSVNGNEKISNNFDEYITLKLNKLRKNVSDIMKTKDINIENIPDCLDVKQGLRILLSGNKEARELDAYFLIRLASALNVDVCEFFEC